MPVALDGLASGMLIAGALWWCLAVAAVLRRVRSTGIAIRPRHLSIPVLTSLSLLCCCGADACFASWRIIHGAHAPAVCAVLRLASGLLMAVAGWILGSRTSDGAALVIAQAILEEERR